MNYIRRFSIGIEGFVGNRNSSVMLHIKYKFLLINIISNVLIDFRI